MPPSNKSATEEWADRFSRHYPTQDAERDIEHLRAKAREFAGSIIAVTPTGREQGAALTALETALEKSIAAIYYTQPDRAGVQQ